MTYMILDSTGSAINAFADEVAARAALRSLVAHDPAAAEHVFLLAYDDDGDPIGDAVTIADLPTQTTSILETELVVKSLTRACYGEVLRYTPAPARPVPAA